MLGFRDWPGVPVRATVVSLPIQPTGVQPVAPAVEREGYLLLLTLLLDRTHMIQKRALRGVRGAAHDNPVDLGEVERTQVALQRLGEQESVGEVRSNEGLDQGKVTWPL